MVFTNKHMLGIYAGILVVYGIMNSVHVRLVAICNDISAWWHLIGTVFLVIFLPAAALVRQVCSTKRFQQLDVCSQVRKVYMPLVLLALEHG